MMRLPTPSCQHPWPVTALRALSWPLYKLGSGAVGREVVETQVSSQPAHTCSNQGQCLLWSCFQTGNKDIVLQELRHRLTQTVARQHPKVEEERKAKDLERTTGRSCRRIPSEKLLARSSWNMIHRPWGMSTLTRGNTGIRQIQVQILTLALYTCITLGYFYGCLEMDIGWWVLLNGFGVRRPKSGSPAPDLCELAQIPPHPWTSYFCSVTQA